MSIKSSEYPMFARLISHWKPRAKKIKVNLKDIAKDAGILPQQLTKIITGKHVKNPRIRTIDAVETALYNAENKYIAALEKAGVNKQ